MAVSLSIVSMPPPTTGDLERELISAHITQRMLTGMLIIHGECFIAKTTTTMTSSAWFVTSRILRENGVAMTYYQQNRARLLSKQLEYYQKHKKKSKSYQRKYAKDNAEKVNAYRQKYRDTHKQEISEYNHKYYLMVTKIKRAMKKFDKQV